MNEVYGRDLDLNLLRVFVAVADAGSVTAAASRLYLTQPAISAALKRLSVAVGAPLFARAGRGLALTARGERLLAAARPHLDALVRAALAPAAFDPATSDRTVRLGLSDACDAWLLPALVRALEAEAPRMRLVVLAVQFRTVAEALASRRVDMAVTVADEVPAGTVREPLYQGGFACVYDPRHARVGRPLTLERYLAHEHVVVSYNGDLRGVVEDALGVTRRVRVSIPTFHGVGALVDGSALLATLPSLVARHVTRMHPRLAQAELPFRTGSGTLELLYPSALADDDALRFVREHVARVARREAEALRTRPPRARAAAPARAPTSGRRSRR